MPLPPTPTPNVPNPISWDLPALSPSFLRPPPYPNPLNSHFSGHNLSYLVLSESLFNIFYLSNIYK